eukprot:TRINITY_DN11270_c0_g1_i1.p1 TRINITY_DN11270_c0_g1~~TRINITY_DN11270_c0_g1_i1.p1  ORF type:complete len:284 (+),score=51.23 TRINITY_DN11270_c0_g1_i1:106-957(+)
MLLVLQSLSASLLSSLDLEHFYCISGTSTSLLQNLPNTLKSLSLREGVLDQKSLRSIDTRILCNLRVLDVGDCQIEDGDALTELINSCHSLSHLSIEGNTLSESNYSQLLQFIENRCCWDKLSFGNSDSEEQDLNFLEALLTSPGISIFSLSLQGYFRESAARLESIIGNNLAFVPSVMRFKCDPCYLARRRALLANKYHLLDSGLKVDQDTEVEAVVLERRGQVAAEMKKLLAHVIAKHTIQSSLKDWTHVPRQIWKYAAGWARMVIALKGELSNNALSSFL